MKQILLTGGRAPATLDLARSLARAGHRVILAESVRHSLTSYSRACNKTYFVAPPRQAYESFKQNLLDIIQKEKIDLLIPSCEEVFWIARAHHDLSRHCQVFCEPLKDLVSWHHKGQFIDKLKGLGLAALETRPICSHTELESLPLDEVVLKPAYSRFATKALLPPHSRESLKAVHPSEANPWLAQSYLKGKALCSYSLAIGGKLTAHTVYGAEFTAGQGSSVVFRHLQHQGIEAFVRQIVQAFGMTGQFAFDFIETSEGEVFALECNPRATSGVHLLASCPAFPQAFWDETVFVKPQQAESIMLASAMLQAFGKSKKKREWLEVFGSSRDALFRWADPLPALLQGLAIWPFLELAWQKKLSLLEASTYDIEWNGEAL
ncbi:MAG: hypothetical protein KC422_09930 [Trueperaceae bacterium]|nr:hypothetical protein [Trueperaceae bacterium]